MIKSKDTERYKIYSKEHDYLKVIIVTIASGFDINELSGKLVTSIVVPYRENLRHGVILSIFEKKK